MVAILAVLQYAVYSQLCFAGYGVMKVLTFYSTLDSKRESYSASFIIIKLVT